MVLAPFIFKVKAVQSLRGNWQTALLVSFFQGIVSTAISILSSTQVPDFTAMTNWEQLWAAVESIPRSNLYLLLGLVLLSLLVTPALQLGCNHYFICRMRGQELGFTGLFSRIHIWGKALWLILLVGVKIFLWSLLFVYPGIIAAIRYSMAPYYLAEDPSISPWEALQKSKNTMRNLKMSYFSLYISFLGWMLLTLFLQTLLGAFGIIVALVAAQFMDLFVTTYMNGAFSAFFLAVSTPEGLAAITRVNPAEAGPRNTSFSAWAGQANDSEDLRFPPQNTDAPEDSQEEDSSHADP
ncbi:MAG: DUF975 family protein [Clostridia bacterium]|nr:DUF975 family protein [Clostridia bacterium]